MYTILFCIFFASLNLLQAMPTDVSLDSFSTLENQLLQHLEKQSAPHKYFPHIAETQALIKKLNINNNPIYLTIYKKLFIHLIRHYHLEKKTYDKTINLIIEHFKIPNIPLTKALFILNLLQFSLDPDFLLHKQTNINEKILTSQLELAKKIHAIIASQSKKRLFKKRYLVALLALFSLSFTIYLGAKLYAYHKELATVKENNLIQTNTIQKLSDKVAQATQNNINLQENIAKQKTQLETIRIEHNNRLNQLNEILTQSNTNQTEATTNAQNQLGLFLMQLGTIETSLEIFRQQHSLFTNKLTELSSNLATTEQALAHANQNQEIAITSIKNNLESLEHVLTNNQEEINRLITRHETLTNELATIRLNENNHNETQQQINNLTTTEIQRLRTDTNTSIETLRNIVSSLTQNQSTLTLQCERGLANLNSIVTQQNTNITQQHNANAALSRQLNETLQAFAQELGDVSTLNTTINNRQKSILAPLTNGISLNLTEVNNTLSTLRDLSRTIALLTSSIDQARRIVDNNTTTSLPSDQELTERLRRLQQNSSYLD